MGKFFVCDCAKGFVGQFCQHGEISLIIIHRISLLTRDRSKRIT